MSYLEHVSSLQRARKPALGKFFLAASGLSIVIAAWNYLQIKSAEKEIKYRKEQLSKPVYQLTEQEMINPPWKKDNLHEWLYRRVIVTGRPVHRLQCLIPRVVYGYPGYECVVPLVVKQSKDREQRYGILMSRGYVRDQAKKFRNRRHVEKVNTQTFLGFVSTLPELTHHGWTQGNALQEQYIENSTLTYANIADMVRKTGLLNKKEASVAIVERLTQYGKLDERESQRYDIDVHSTHYYPMAKTEAGALQLPSMPWELRNRAKNYLGVSVISFIVGASLF